MGHAASEPNMRRLLLEEIERIVADTARAGTILRTGEIAARLAEIYPGTNFSIGRIIDEIIASATVAKVAVEISRPDSGSVDNPLWFLLNSGDRSAPVLRQRPATKLHHKIRALRRS